MESSGNPEKRPEAASTDRFLSKRANRTELAGPCAFRYKARGLMTNNDVLRALRHALELTPSDFVAFFAEGGKQVKLEAVAAMLKEDDEPGFLRLDDDSMGRLLDGLIATKRGRREVEAPPVPDGGSTAPRATPRPLTQMNNNRILRALRIAFELKDVELVACMHQAGREVSKAELGALFRREDHRNFQPCGDQFLRTFLRGLGLWHKQGKMRD